MGLRLFLGRDGSGKWIPYDTEAEDENRECLVRERPWPFCWGDVIWTLHAFDDQPVFMRREVDDDGEIALGPPFVHSGSRPRSWLYKAVAVETMHARELPPTFWRRERPPRDDPPR